MCIIANNVAQNVLISDLVTIQKYKNSYLKRLSYKQLFQEKKNILR